jgi:hypothetical protein
MSKPRPTLCGGRNIAMKVPPHLYDETVGFYRDVLGLPEITTHAPDIGFEFGANQLWIDRVPQLSQAELWLELVSDDIATTERKLAAAGVVRCDDIEPLGESARAFWIMNPASIVHLVCPGDAAW